MTISRIVAVLLGVIIALPQTAQAQSGRISLVRDAEIEALVQSYARPLLRAAGLRRGAVKFHIVNDPGFNAFVSGRGLFLNTGLLLQTEDPNEVIGVIAHELGHIIGGHQIKLRQRLETATRIARLTSLLGIGIGVAGAAAGSGEVGSAGIGIAAGGGRLALRDLLRYQRGEETAADRTAVRLLRATKQSGRGMLKTFRRLNEKMSILGGRVDPYLISHPLPNQRIAQLRSSVEKSPYYSKKSSASLRQRHDMARAKLAAYVGGNKYARALLSGKKLSADARLYGRAIVTHLYGSPRRAIPLIEKLIKRQPNNAYAHEMKGEILLRSGKAALAVAPFRRAVKLDKTGAGFLRVELGHALLESGKKGAAKEAIVQLRKGVARDPSAIAGYQYLARAYAETGNQPAALLASAEFAFRTGQKTRAKSFAKRAQRAYKRGSPGWLRAQDIINLK